MKTPPPASAQRRSGKKRGFTLVEIMTAAAVAGLVLAAVGSILVISLRLFNKNRQIDDAITNTRLVQEHLNAQMAIAVSQKQGSLTIRPTFSDASTTTPVRYGTMIYRVPIGSFGTVQSDTASTSTSISVTCPSDVVPKVGDYFMMDSPNLGRGIQITSVTLTPQGGGTDSTASITLATTLAAGTDGTVVDALSGKLVHFQRERKYETVLPTGTQPYTELRWYENTQDETYVVLSKNVDSHARYLFAQIPDNPDADEASVSWQFTYVATGSNTYNQGGDKSFYQSNYAEGLVMPKSGDPLSASSILGGGPTTAVSTTTLGTSTTLVSSTTTIKVSSTTTTKGTSTTLVSSTTTTKGTSTTKVSSTTLVSTTTTKGTTTTTTSTLGTSTTKVSTTTTTTSKGTTTTTTSTLGTSTTKLSTTTTLGTSTTKVSSTTTTKGTSTTLLSTTTTTLGTSTTKLSTTTTTSKATTTTTTTKGTTTTTTTTIPFDG